MRIATQTHRTVTNEPCAELPELPGIFFLGGDDFITGWGAAKFSSEPTPEASGTIVEISDVAEELGREAREIADWLLEK